MNHHDLQLEKARLLSLALQFGFHEETATKCLDRLVQLYGDDGRDFITVEHCGDDFLALLAESMEDTEEWDDLGDAELEAGEDLGKMLEDQVVGNGCNGNSVDVHVIEDDDSPVLRGKNTKFVELDSSSDSELSSRSRKRKHGESTPASCSDWPRSRCDFAQSLGSLDQIVTLNLKFGLPASFLNSQQSISQASAVLGELRKDKPSCKLLYVTPERVAGNAMFLEDLTSLHQKGQLAGFVVDDAHCVRKSMW